MLKCRQHGSAGEAGNRRGRAVAGHDLGEQHLAPGALHEIGADHLVKAVVGAFDEELRPQIANELDRRVLLEE